MYVITLFFGKKTLRASNERHQQEGLQSGIGLLVIDLDMLLKPNDEEFVHLASAIGSLETLETTLPFSMHQWMHYYLGPIHQEVGNHR